MIEHEILLFAGLKERLGRPSTTVRHAPDATLEEILAVLADQHPELRDLLGPCRVAVEHAFVPTTHRPGPDDEIALIPPVSGGHDGPGPRARVALFHEPLGLQAVLEQVEHPGAGGVTTFTGNVRDWSRGAPVDHLEYEAYEPMALEVMGTIVRDIEARIRGTRVAIHHRLGRLAIGETAVVIAASAPHRAEAFEACRAAIEALKQDVPIWKKEVSPDGSSWIGRGP